jgi:hypothetical protein
LFPLVSSSDWCNYRAKSSFMDAFISSNCGPTSARGMSLVIRLISKYTYVVATWLKTKKYQTVILAYLRYVSTRIIAPCCMINTACSFVDLLWRRKFCRKSARPKFSEIQELILSIKKYLTRIIKQHMWNKIRWTFVAYSRIFSKEA